MTNTNDKIGSHPGVSILERAKFGRGMLLKHGDLEQLNVYTRDLNRLMFRSFFGCGVVCGLVVSAEPDCGKLKVTVTGGLALSCSGDPVYVPPTNQPFLTDDKLSDNDDKFWVVLCGTTKCCAPRVTTCSSDDDEATSDCTRERDGYEIRVMRNKPECGCGCLKTPDTPPPPPPPTPQFAAGTGKELTPIDCKCADPTLPCYFNHYDGICECDCGECSGCDCECIVLAKLLKTNNVWTADHRWRRFIRPVLMRDPQVEKEKPKPVALKKDEGHAPAEPASAPVSRVRTRRAKKT